MGTRERPEDMTNIESILEKNNNIKYNCRWHPTTVKEFEELLQKGAFEKMNREIRKNICYSLVYLQYIQLQLEELHLHNIVEKHLYKSYIITAMGIIEGIFYHLVKINSCQKTTEWEPQNPIHTNVVKENGIEMKYVITQEIKLEKPRDEQMDFEYLINKVQNKKLLSLPYQVYPQIKALKRLRNKVHLQIATQTYDTDYWNFERIDYILVRSILFLVITNQAFAISKDSVLKFLKPEKDDIEKLKKHLKRIEERKAQKSKS